MTLRTWFTGALALLGAAPAAAQSPTSPPPNCSAPEHRQFDFWVGDWTVETPDGRPQGRNVITAILGGCVLHEQWTSARGSSGQSFNIFDRTTGTWHQTWVDASGTLLRIEGGLVNGAMVLQNEEPGPNGARQRNRITWTPLPDGRVRQLWEQSQDAGGSWQVAFDGVYRRRS